MRGAGPAHPPARTPKDLDRNRTSPTVTALTLSTAARRGAARRRASSSVSPRAPKGPGRRAGRRSRGQGVRRQARRRPGDPRRLRRRGRGDQAARAGRLQGRRRASRSGSAPMPEKDDAYDTEALRRAAGVAARTLAGAEEGRVRAARRATPSDVEAIAEGALLGAYAFTAYQAQNGRDKRRQERRGAARRGRPARREAARQGAQGGRRARHRGGRGGQPGPRPDQHPAERPDPEGVRRRRAGRRQGARPQGRGARREGARQGRLRRHPRRRPGLGARRRAWSGWRTRTRKADQHAGLRRQGHHLRLGRHLAEAGRAQRDDEVRHERRRRRVRRGRGAPPSSA